MSEYKPLFFKKGVVYLLNQLVLPHKVQYVPCKNAAGAAKAIHDMVVRGAPLIGQTAVWGLYLECVKAKSEADWDSRWKNAWKVLAASRPTARNLVAAMEDVQKQLKADTLTLPQRKKRFLAILNELERRWIDITNGLARHGASTLKIKGPVVTICNTGRLATLGRGTALASIEEGWKKGMISHVYALETRPYLQGARLTMWELEQLKIKGTLITDNMAAHLMATHKISAIFTGCDRVAANGDSANKIGTLGLAVLAKHFNVPFYIVAPTETIDKKIATGKDIVIEERSTKEVIEVRGQLIAPKNAKAWHPAFDVTPHELITAIVTENGLWDPN